MRKKNCDIFVALTFVLICLHRSDGFNVSPVPNIIIREPKTINNANSSYFGLSINLKTNRYVTVNMKFGSIQSHLNCNYYHTMQYNCVYNLSNYLVANKHIHFDSILIGAPRAQLNYSKAQMGIIGAGAIYKCDLNNNSDENCKLFKFDEFGYEQEQWMGMSIDGSANDNQTFVVNKDKEIIEN